MRRCRMYKKWKIRAYVAQAESQAKHNQDQKEQLLSIFNKNNLGMNH